VGVGGDEGVDNLRCYVYSRISFLKSCRELAADVLPTPPAIAILTMVVDLV
jgi:hypothetical protein